MIRDLLNPSSGFLDLREDSKGVIQVAGITEVSTINAQEVRRATLPCMFSFISMKTLWLQQVCLCVFRSWNYWWGATSSAPKSRPPPTRRRPAPTLCCRWPWSSRAGVETSCRKSALHASSWSTSPDLNERHRCVFTSPVRRRVIGGNYVLQVFCLQMSTWLQTLLSTILPNWSSKTVFVQLC